MMHLKKSPKFSVTVETAPPLLHCPSWEVFLEVQVYLVWFSAGLGSAYKVNQLIHE